jgi:hypothetical protein
MCGIGHSVGSSAATTTRRAPRLFRSGLNDELQIWSVPNVYPGSVTPVKTFFLGMFPQTFAT